MTIAAGFVANDGMLLCADSQQTISGYIKTYEGKVVTHILREPPLVIAIVGAGTVPYVKTASAAILKDFPNIEMLDDIENHFKERLLTFFDKHLSPWASFPDRERPTVELLIGVTGRNTPHALFHYEGTSFCRSGTKAIGDGVLLANDLIHRYCFGNYTLSQLTALAIYILSKVKKGVDGCGGSTHIVALRKGLTFAMADNGEITKLEAEFLKLESTSDKAFAASVVKRPPSLRWFSQNRQKILKPSTAQKSGSGP